MAWSDAPSAPYELLDDGTDPPTCELLVIGCGNILRGDDAVGPVLIRHLFTAGTPDGVRLVDGGTSGMDVAFAMRGAQRVVIVDAAQTGKEPGTVFRVPAEELGELPPIDGLHTHNFRWDHALSFGSWLLGPERPTDITVYLVEGAGFGFGDELTPAVAEAMDRVRALVVAEHYPKEEPEHRVEITEAGNLHLRAAVAEEYFPAGVCVAATADGPHGPELHLRPLAGAGNGGLILKQRNRAGDRSLLISEVLAFEPPSGTFAFAWDPDQGLMRIDLSPGGGDERRGDPGTRVPEAVAGLAGGDDRGRGQRASAADPPHRGESAAGRGRRTPDPGPAAQQAGGPR